MGTAQDVSSLNLLHYLPRHRNNVPLETARLVVIRSHTKTHFLSNSLSLFTFFFKSNRVKQGCILLVKEPLEESGSTFCHGLFRAISVFNAKTYLQFKEIINPMEASP